MKKFTEANMEMICRHCKFQNSEKCSDCKKNSTESSILYDCENFYYAFKLIENYHKTPTFTGDIEQYRKEMTEYEKNAEDTPILMQPLVVNGALALELALKYLIYKENGEFDCTHNPQNLYNSLPDSHKIVLTEKIFKELHQNGETMQFNLNNIANLFEHGRYSFDYNLLGYSNFFTEIVHVVCDYALSFKSKDFDAII